MAVVLSAPTIAETKLYGEMHASYDKLKADSEISQDTIALNSSHIGIKGTRDLKKDLSVIYQLEWGMDSRDNVLMPVGSSENIFSSRNQIIGLAGKRGAIIVGRYDLPLKMVGRQADLFWSSQLGQNRNITNPDVWDLRADKIIAYQSPKINGFQGLIAYAADIGGPDINLENSSAISVNGFYKFGAVKLGAAYENQSLENSGTHREAVRLTANYKKGPLQLVGFYQNEDNGFALTMQPDATVYGLGAAYEVGAGTFKGQYYSRQFDATGSDPQLMAVGYDYKLAKKTDVYVQTVKVTEGQKLGGAGHGASTISDVAGDASGISFGVRHKF